MKNLFLAALVCGLAVTPVHAETNLFKLYRDNDGLLRVSIATKLPYRNVKQCVLAKSYLLNDGKLLPRDKEQIKSVRSSNGTGETYWWGIDNANSIDFTEQNGVTTVALYGNFPLYAKLDGDARQLPTQLFSYFSECTDDGKIAKDTSSQIDNVIYKLDSSASPTFMADCVLNNAHILNRVQGRIPHLNPHISRNVDGFYAVDYYKSYTNTGEKLFIGATGNGSRVGWTRPSKKAFLVIKLDDPANNFDRDRAEKSHIIISDIKQCADIAEGKKMPIRDFPKPPKRLSAVEVFDKFAPDIEARYIEGKIEMAEMPLEIQAGYEPAANETLDNLIKAAGPAIPVKFIAAAAIPDTRPLKKKTKKKSQIASEPAELILPLVYIHPRDGSRLKDKSAIMQDVANHLYCDESDSTDFKGLITVACYQDVDKDGLFEVKRIANVKYKNSVSYIYFITEPREITPLAYRKLDEAAIPTTKISYKLGIDSGSLTYCTSYLGTISSINANFCYLSLLPNMQTHEEGILQYDAGELSVWLTGPLSKKSIVQSVKSYAPGTLVGKTDWREPITQFGTEALWIDAFLEGREYLELRNMQFGPNILKDDIAMTGSAGKLVATTYQEPILHLKSGDVIDAGSGNNIGIEPGQSLVGFSFSFDKPFFEPARLFACGMERQTQSTKSPSTFCFVADRPSSNTYFRFSGNLNFIPNRYMSVERGPTLSATPASIGADKIWTQRLYFDGWSLNENGQDVAKFTQDSFYEDRPVNSVATTVLLENGVGKKSIAGVTFNVRKLDNGGYELFEGTPNDIDIEE